MQNVLMIIVMSLVMWFGSHIVFNMKTFKKLIVRNGWTDQTETLQVLLPIHEEQKVLHLWCPRSHGLAAMIFWRINFSSPERLDRLRGNFTHMFPKPWGYQFVHKYLIGHTVWQPYWIEWKSFKNSSSWTASSINRKRHIYDVVITGNIWRIYPGVNTQNISWCLAQWLGQWLGTQ